MHKLLCDHLEFLSSFLRSGDLTESIRVLYRGTLRVLLVLLHDQPEFLCGFHWSFLDIIPVSSIQLRNLILSAFPTGMRLPDPFTPNLRIEMLPDIEQPPVLLADYREALLKAGLMEQFTAYLSGSDRSFLDSVGNYLYRTESNSVAMGRYHVPRLNAIVLHICVYHISTGAPIQTIKGTFGYELLDHLMKILDNEGNYFLTQCQRTLSID